MSVHVVLVALQYALLPCHVSHLTSGAVSKCKLPGQQQKPETSVVTAQPIKILHNHLSITCWGPHTDRTHPKNNDSHTPYSNQRVKKLWQYQIIMYKCWGEICQVPEGGENLIGRADCAMSLQHHHRTVSDCINVREFRRL